MCSRKANERAARGHAVKRGLTISTGKSIVRRTSMRRIAIKTVISLSSSILLFSFFFFLFIFRRRNAIEAGARRSA